MFNGCVESTRCVEKRWNGAKQLHVLSSDWKKKQDHAMTNFRAVSFCLVWTWPLNRLKTLYLTSNDAVPSSAESSRQDQGRFPGQEESWFQSPNNFDLWVFYLGLHKYPTDVLYLCCGKLSTKKITNPCSQLQRIKAALTKGLFYTEAKQLTTSLGAFCFGLKRMFV